MIDLYGALGIPRDASQAEIKKAFRKMAKKHHPDHGGSPAQFAVVKLAYDTLADPARRQRYDETGTVDEKAVDNTLSEALGIISGALDHVLGVCIQRGLDPTEIDMIGDLKQTIDNQKREAHQKAEAFDKLLKQAKKLAGKFKATKDAPNHMESIIAGRVGLLEQQKQNVATHISRLDMAKDIVSAHSFSWSPPKQDDMHSLNQRTMAEALRDAMVGRW